MSRKYIDEDIETIVKQLVNHLQDMPDGTAIDTWHLLKGAGYDMDSFSEEDLMDIHDDLFDTAKSRHIILDMSAHENSLEGLPFLLDYLVWNHNNSEDVRPVSKDDMENYISCFEEDEYLNAATEPMLAKARSYIDLLCQEENVMALHIKGYACYGGNRLYPCDWKASRDCMLLLYDKTDNPLYANTLGYIYYYGRCNGGLPEYDKAFHYFGISAANGLYEGMYKLADMFAHGYGCRKSPGTARSLYEIVYKDSLRHYLQGEENAFADAALRMGNVYAKGIGTEVNVYAAYEYYLQAEYAAGIRARESDFFGNATVVINIQKALEEVCRKLPEDYMAGYLDYVEPYLFANLAEDRHRCRLSRVINPGGHTELIAERLPCRQETDPDPILLKIPQASFCDLTKRISMTVDDQAEIWFKGDAREVKYDSCEWSYAYSRYEFYYDEELVAWTRSDFYRFYGSPEDEPYGPEYSLVSVRFDANGRTYDYICEDPEVKAGDRVVVNGYDGETEVTVTDVRVKRESELPLPVERYKKIVRKVEALDDMEGITMKNGISLEEAIKKAKNRKPKYNRCVEHPNAWSFSYDDGTDEISIGGPDTGIVIMKEDGRMLMPYEYYMNDEIGSAEVIDEFDI